MKLLAKTVIATVAAIGGGATLYAGPGLLAADGSGSPAPAAMVARASELRSEMLDAVTEVLHMQQKARREKDVIKLNCLNDKLVEMKPEVNIGEHAQAQLTASQSPSDQQTAFATLSQASDAVRALRESAEQCIGKPLLATESSNDYTHPEIVDQPPVPGSLENEIEPPAYASPVN